MKRGAAYHCAVTAEELQARRDEAEQLQKKKSAEGHLSAADADRMAELMRPFRSPWRDPTTPLPAGAPTVVRLRMPDHGELTVHDHVQGTVSRAYADLDDLIMLRSDGTPTYMLAVVVDDHDMGVTHVIRGDDHFLNTFRQLPIYLGMGWRTPDYSHVPLIHGPDGKKLSKRHGATAVDEYRDVLGYLPEAMRNYLLRLGWSHGDDEIIPDEKAIAWFDLDGLNKAPARLDFAKLELGQQALHGAGRRRAPVRPLDAPRPRRRRLLDAACGPHPRRDAASEDRGDEPGRARRGGPLPDRPAARSSLTGKAAGQVE